jgi:uncharacterized protein YyaL (SSP411 family)
VWTEAQVDAALGAEATFFKRVYDVTPGGNWEHKTILNRSAHPDLLDDAEEARLAAARETLLAARASRVRPGWDDKVLADWNGLMIAALAEASQAFAEPAWLAAAEEAFAFVRGSMVRAGRLLHSWRGGKLQHAATLDDYAHMARAALALHEATGKADYLAAAQGWVGTLNGHYWDEGDGGYYFTANDTGDVLLRPKTATDSATPSGNGTMVGVLARLHYLTGEAEYRTLAGRIVTVFSGMLAQNVFGFATLLNGLEVLQAGLQIVIAGERGRADTQALLDVVHASSLPNRVLAVVPDPDALPQGHPAAGKGAQGGRATAYICRGPVCSLPLSDPAALRAALALG